jgi:hypothetical protein
MLVLGSWGRNALAQDSEVDRLSGFAKHQSNDEQYDKARIQGEREYLEEVEQWEHKKERELQAYKTISKDRRVDMDEDSPDAKADAVQKKKLAEQYEEDRKKHSLSRAKNKSFDRQALGLPSEIKELGLDQERPRYDYRKRASFGATTKLGKNTFKSSGSSSGGYSGGGGGGSRGGNSFPPPPPAFDDFQDGGGYLPAPTLNDDYMGDIPPPPPPPPPFGGEGMGGGINDFPPPPPPTFGDEGGGGFLKANRMRCRVLDVLISTPSSLRLAFGALKAALFSVTLFWLVTCALRSSLRC